MKTFLSVLVVIILLSFTKNSYSQETGYIEICSDYNKDTYECKGKFSSVYPNYVWVVFESFKDNFGEMTLIERTILISSSEEKIYNSQEIEIEPDWKIIWDYKYFPNGIYQIKYYNKSGKLLAESKEFTIFKK